MSGLLQNLLQQRRNTPAARGIYSVCSAHPWVIRASVQQAVADDSPLLVEATSNQVNQLGGYTGMRPAEFRVLVSNIAAEEGLAPKRLILGGDHLGPNPWRRQRAEDAMPLGEAMAAEYAAAGFAKLHLDASMSCADDPTPLSDEVIAERAARMCAAAEQACTGERPVYIIGTEVPVPGGATESFHGLEVTRREAAEKTLAIHRDVFAAHGLRDAWTRVVAMVVQPGVEFNHDSVIDYVPSKATGLIPLLDAHPGIVFEAHSTDYQRPEAYAELVHDGFAILKVGPALTFAMREALFALAQIECELVDAGSRSNLPDVMDAAMLRNPADWEGHYHGSEREQRFLRRYSYSDRMRYYWGDLQVQRATERLIGNLHALTIPETLLSAWLPLQYRAVREGTLRNAPVPMVLHAVRQALGPYASACFPR